MPIRLMLAVLAAAASGGCFDASTAPAGNRPAAAEAPRGAAAATVEDARLELRLDALAAPRPQRRVGERNPFQFAGRGAADAAAAGAAPAAGQPHAPGAVPDRPAAPAGGGETPSPLRFIALADAPRSAGLIAVLSDGDTVFHGRVGDTIDGRYRIMSIGTDSAEIALLETGERQVLHRDGTQ